MKTRIKSFRFNCDVDYEKQAAAMEAELNKLMQEENLIIIGINTLPCQSNCGIIIYTLTEKPACRCKKHADETENGEVKLEIRSSEDDEDYEFCDSLIPDDEPTYCETEETVLTQEETDAIDTTSAEITGTESDESVFTEEETNMLSLISAAVNTGTDGSEEDAEV